MKHKVKNFFSICVAINIILITTFFILSKSIDNSRLIAIEDSSGKAHLAVDDIDKSEVDGIRRDFDIESIYEYQYFDGNKNLEDKALTVISTNDDFINVKGVAFIKGEFPQNDDDVMLEKWVYDNLKKYIHGDVIELDLLEHGKKSFKISGIIEDIGLNKRLGKIEIYKKINNEGKRNAFIVLKDDNKKDNIEKLSGRFKKKNKEVSINTTLIDAEVNNRFFTVKTFVLCFSFFILVYISVKGIYYISIKSKLKDYGTLRALGIKKIDIFIDIYYDILISSILPSIIGFSIGVIVSFLMKNIIRNIYELTFFEITIDYSLVIIFIPLFLGLLILTVENYFRIIRCNIIDLVNYETEASSNCKNIRYYYSRSNSIIEKMAINNILQNWIKNLVIFLSLSIISSILAGVLFYYGMEDVVYKQEIKYSGSGYNYTIESFPLGGKTNTGIDEVELDSIKTITVNNKKAVEDIESFKVVNGRILMEKDDLFDRKYLEDYTSENSENLYFKKVLKWVGREKDGVYEIRSNIIGVEDSYIEKIKNSIEDFDIDSFKKGKGAILYDPLHQEKYEGVVKNNSYNKDIDFKYTENFSEKIGDDLDDNGYEKRKVEYKTKRMNIIGRTNDLNIRLSSYIGHETLNLIVSNKFIDKYIGLNKYKIIKLDSYKDIDSKKFKDKLLKITENNPSVNIMDNKEEIVKANTYYDSKKNIFIGFFTLLLIILSINLSNSMLYRISLRKNEFILLKNIGATSRQVKKIVILEGLYNGIAVATLTLILTFAIQSVIYYGYYSRIMLEKYYYDNFSMIVFILIFNILVGLMSSLLGMNNEKM